MEYIFYIFFRENFPKPVKTTHRFHGFVAYSGINARVSAISLTRDIVLINKPHVVKKFFAFLKAAEHCYDAFLPRYKVKP